MKIFLVLVFCFKALVANNDTGSFLFYMPMAFRSMQIGWSSLIRELSSRGHKITVIASREMYKDDSRITEIAIDPAAIKECESIMSHKTMYYEDPFAAISWVDGVIKAQKSVFEHPSVKNMIAKADKKEEKVFDVVVVCCALYGEEPGYYLAHRMNSTLVLAHSKSYANAWENWSTGNPFNPAYMPLFGLPFSQRMGFFERVANTLATVLSVASRDWYMLRRSNNLLIEMFPEEKRFPDLLDLESKAALIMNAGNPFLSDGLRPVMPNNLLVGMMNCKPHDSNRKEDVGKLPKKLKDWIDGSGKEGVIYMSFGSVLKASSMSSEKREMILDVLGSLSPIRVIWKWEEENIQNVPSNILTMPWVPQTDILANPKVKVFITHGGAGSVQEAICHKIPLLGIPLSNDQKSNLLDAENRGIAYVLPWKGLSKEAFLAGIQSVLHNDKNSLSSYQMAINHLHELVMDQPMHPVDRATWWMEYLIRHPNPDDAMRSPALELLWWQYLLIDVLIFLVVVVISFIIVVRFLFNFFCCRNKNSRKPKNE